MMGNGRKTVTKRDRPRYCIESVRSNDPDRYVLAMFAPAPLREALIALFAFNIEIARTRELVSERPLGEIRLQWWRDGVAAIYAGEGLDHGVGVPLAAAIDEFDLSRTYFDRLIDARESDMDDDPPDTMDSMLHYAEETTAPLVALTFEVLGDRSPEMERIARHLGIAWSLMGLIRALPFHLRARRIYLPIELLRRHQVRERDLYEIRPSENLNRAVAEISDLVSAHLKMAGPVVRLVGRRAVPVLLQASLTEIYRHRLTKLRFNPFDPRGGRAPSMIAWRLLFRKWMARY